MTATDAGPPAATPDPAEAAQPAAEAAATAAAPAPAPATTSPAVAKSPTGQVIFKSPSAGALLHKPKPRSSFSNTGAMIGLLEDIIKDPPQLAKYTEYLKKQFANESLDFILAVDKLVAAEAPTSDAVEGAAAPAGAAEELFNLYIKPGCDMQVNVSAKCVKATRKLIDTAATAEATFAESRQVCAKVLARDKLKGFVEQQEADAAKRRQAEAEADAARKKRPSFMASVRSSFTRNSFTGKGKKVAPAPPTAETTPLEMDALIAAAVGNAVSMVEGGQD